MDELKNIKLDSNETLVSYDVVSLFTKTPVDQSLKVARNRLENDKKLKKRTKLSVNDIMELLTFVLTTTYFSFRGQIYQQKFGVAMGSPVSPIIVNLFMEHLEQRAINTAPEDLKPRYWKRYVDDVLAIIRRGKEKELNQHLDSIDASGNVKFTHEEMTDNRIPFLDANITLLEDGSLKAEVYRKATHTNQYLSFHSQHPVTHKLGVVRTLLDRCDAIVTEPADATEEEKNIQKALTACGYPRWTFKRVRQQIDMKKAQPNSTKPGKKSKERKSRGHVTIPYMKGLSERLSRIMRSYNIGTSYKPHTTIRQLLVHPKDKVDKERVCGTVYQVSCQNCDKVYVGESGRQLGTRMSEHMKEVEEHTCTGVRTRTARSTTTGTLHKSAITDHAVDNDHTPDWDNASILARESDSGRRLIREAIWIRRKDNINRDEGAFRLSHTYDDLILPNSSKRGGHGHPN